MVIAILVFLLVIGIYAGIHSSTDHWRESKNTNLDPNAVVIDVTSRPYDRYSFETTVKFDDGFVYQSYKTESERHFGSKTIYVTPEMKKEIIQAAIQKHTELLQEQGISEKSAQEKQFTVCSTEEQLLSYLNNCAEKNQSSFSVNFTPDYARHLFANTCAELDNALQHSRLKPPYDYTCSPANSKLIVNTADWYGSFSRKEALLDYLKNCRKQKRTSFQFFCNKELFQDLSSNHYSNLSAVLKEAGCKNNNRLYVNETSRMFFLSNVNW